MNHSFYSIDRITHLKIVMVALVAAIAVAMIGVAAHVESRDGLTQAETIAVIKVGKPVLVSQDSKFAIR